jgi:hypothetical protein
MLCSVPLRKSHRRSSFVIPSSHTTELQHRSPLRPPSPTPHHRHRPRLARFVKSVPSFPEHTSHRTPRAPQATTPLPPTTPTPSHLQLPLRRDRTGRIGIACLKAPAPAVRSLTLLLPVRPSNHIHHPRYGSCGRDHGWQHHPRGQFYTHSPQHPAASAACAAPTIGLEHTPAPCAERVAASMCPLFERHDPSTTLRTPLITRRQMRNVKCRKRDLSGITHHCSNGNAQFSRRSRMRFITSNPRMPRCRAQHCTAIDTMGITSPNPRNAAGCMRLMIHELIAHSSLQCALCHGTEPTIPRLPRPRTYLSYPVIVVLIRPKGRCGHPPTIAQEPHRHATATSFVQ